MRNILTVVICCAVMLLSTSFAHAILFVAQISGDPQFIKIKRSGKDQPLESFMALQKDDVISISADKTSLTLLEDGRNPINLDRSNTPYTVLRLNETQSTWNKVVMLLQDTFQPESKSKAFDTVVREQKGKQISPSDHPITLLALYPHGDNWVTLQSQPLVIAWEGGQPPFTIKLLDAQNEILEQLQVTEYTATLSNEKLQIGQRYRIEVSYIQQPASSQARANELWDERIFTIVTTDKLPAEIQQLGELPLAVEVITRLKIAHLALMPEWRFQAFQEAQGDDMEVIRKKILLPID